jgi:hypothetical protein
MPLGHKTFAALVEAKPITLSPRSFPQVTQQQESLVAVLLQKLYQVADWELSQNRDSIVIRQTPSRIDRRS